MRYINFNQLRSFHAVAETGNVTEAARLLSISQPTVTTQLKSLEQDYGVELVHRLSRGVRLTALGRSLHGLTLRLFGLEDEALELLDFARDLEAGHLAAGAVGPLFIMDLLGTFSGHHPKITISLKTGNTEDLLQDLLDYRIDVAVLGNVAHDPRLITVPYSRQAVVLLVGKSHAWGGRRQVRLEDLQGQPMIQREPGSETRRVLQAALAQRGVEPRVIMEVDRDSVHEAAAAGLGIGIVSEAELRPDARLQTLRFRGADVHTRADVACLEERESVRLITAFMQIARGGGANRGGRSI